ncbi:MAG: hypothetical protein IB618_03495 [Candidatus Pacearchaeota archaeon]|nr:MAG: hypothetical protein IB618_03495 [Candidatus Pacearchaeota archaeon]
MVAETIGIFAHPFFTNIILPFLLVFVVIYAILEKTTVLGKDKRYANLIVAFVIGFMFIGAQALVGFTIKLLPLIAVMIIILLGYFLVFGFIGIEKSKGMQIALGILFGIAILAAVFWAAGVFEMITPSTWSPDTIAIIVFLVIFGGAIALVLATAPKPKPKST